MAWITSGTEHSYNLDVVRPVLCADATALDERLVMPGTELRLVYTVTEAAELLGLSRSTAYHLVATGELPTIRLGRRLAVTRPALTELLGLEPPLPHELETARRAVAAPAPVRRPERSPTRQPGLPFTG